MEATAMDIARSLWIIYRQMPAAVQHEFKRLIDDEDEDAGWMKLTEEALRDDWEAPENDVWDEFYAKQHA
ncbi:hypothetical protein [Spirosoma areae]